MISIIPYDHIYEHRVQSLFEIPVSGTISLSLQRRPNSKIGAKVQTENPKVYLAVLKEQDEVIGLFNIGTRSVYWNGKPILMPYYCDLRIHPDYQNGMVFLKMMRFIKENEIDLDHLPASTIVFADNNKMLALIKKRSAGVLSELAPYYQKITDIETFIFKWAPKIFNSNNYLICRASEKDVEKMLALQLQNQRELMLSVDYNGLGKNSYYFTQKIEDYVLCYDSNQLVGILGLWDTSSFKQIVVRKYNRWLLLMRPIYNFIARCICTFPELPKEGGNLKYVAIHSLVISDRNPEVFKALLSYLTTDKLNTYMLTLDKKDPLYPTMLQIKPAIRKKGHYFLITKSKKITKSIDWIPIDAPRI